MKVSVRMSRADWLTCIHGHWSQQTSMLNQLLNHHRDPPATIHFSCSRETSLFILSCLSSLYLCGKNATHLRCLQVVRAGGREAWVRRTLRQARDKQERHLWVEAIISHPKDIIPLRCVPLIDNEQQAKTVTSSRKDKTFFHYWLVLIYIKGSTFRCFLPLHHLKFEMNHKKMEQVGLVHRLTERKMRRKFWKVAVTSDLLWWGVNIMPFSQTSCMSCLSSFLRVT